MKKWIMLTTVLLERMWPNNLWWQMAIHFFINIKLQGTQEYECSVEKGLLSLHCSFATDTPQQVETWWGRIIWWGVAKFRTRFWENWVWKSRHIWAFPSDWRNRICSQGYVWKTYVCERGFFYSNQVSSNGNICPCDILQGNVIQKWECIWIKLVIRMRATITYGSNCCVDILHLYVWYDNFFHITTSSFGGSKLNASIWVENMSMFH